MRQKKFWFAMSEILAVLVMALMLPTGVLAAGKSKMLHMFKGHGDGKHPLGGLIFDGAGNLYGTTSEGGSVCEHGCGAVFEMTPNSNGTWTERLLHTFNGNDGFEPSGDLVFDAAGNLYGTTRDGGSSGYGTVFELTPNSDGSWTESLLYSFCSLPKCADGANPYAGVILDGAGNLYGTTAGAGISRCQYGCGTVFKLKPNSDGTWTESVVNNFAGAMDGANPVAGLLFDEAGNLYGTTSNGGSKGCLRLGCGVVFKLVPNADGSWTEHVLHQFTGGRDGSNPWARMIFDATGNLYGTTRLGGNRKFCGSGCGVVFKLIPHSDGSWTESVLHTFTNHPGNTPYAGLTFDASGSLYGTTAFGGPVAGGVVFKLTPQSDGSWKDSVLHVFQGNLALRPEGDLVLDNTGNLYGTSSDGNGSCQGVVFKITP